MNQWTEPDPHYCLALALWADYRLKTEAFDLLVCSARTEDGTAIPVGADEIRAINAYAYRLRRQLEDESFSWNIPTVDMIAAKKNTVHLNEQALRYWAERMEEFKEKISSATTKD